MSTRLTRAEIDQAAREYGIEPAALRAVTAVESGGSGFLPNGWCKILFERHHLWKRLLGRGINPAHLATARPDLCGRTWQRRWYQGGVREWDRVAAVIAWAQKNDPARWESYKKAAYESCSWGLFQLMGFHYTAAGYTSIYDFKHALEASEAAQLRAILRWMSGNGLLDKLRAKDWNGFTRGYNGSGQVAFYSARIRVAYLRERLRK